MKSLSSDRSWAGLAFIGILLCASCDHPSDTHVNDPPFVQIMTRPQGERVPYAVDIYWTGWDRDGVIDHYQYTLDVPPGVTLDQLNDPEFTGVTWTATEAPGALFLFSTSEPDSLVREIQDGTLIFRDLYHGDHNLFVRAVDNEGAVSPVDYIEFTSENVAPQTTISVQAGECRLDFSSPLSLRTTFVVHLDGVDPDRPGPDHEPASYEWKWIPVPIAPPPWDGSIINDTVNESGGAIPWIRVPAGRDTLHVTAPVQQQLVDQVLAVRSIDVQGGTERWFELGRNALYMLGPLPDRWLIPTLTIREPILGKMIFPGPPNWAETAVGFPLRFDLAAEASSGAAITGFCVQVDESDSANCSWTLQTHFDLTFSSPGQHTVVFRTRDCLGNVTSGTLALDVVAFTMDREVLYVDDFRKFKDQGVPDAQMDAMAVDMLRSIGIPESGIFKVDTFGEGDVTQNPTPVPLSELARYRQVVWSVYGIAYNGNPALAYAAACEGRFLPVYVWGGGRTLIYGQKMMGAFKRYGPELSACRGTVGYSESVGLSFFEGTFPCDLAGLCGGDFRDVTSKPRDNGLIRARPPAGAASADVPFPPVEVDSALFSTVTQVGGIPFVDANIQPTFTAGLDTLYIVEQAAKTTSVFRNKPIAWRYADPDPVPSQGPVALFGFPFHLLKQGEVTQGEDGKYRGTGVKGLVAATFEWFRRNGDVARAALPR